MSLTIAQVLPSLESGGVERGTVELSAELVARGHRSIVISGGGKLVRKLERHGCQHITLPVGRKSPLTFKLIPTLRQLFLNENITIIHARSRLPAWLCFLAWKKMPPSGRPGFITTVHGPYSVNWYSSIMMRGERVIAVSDFIRRYILENYPDTPVEKIATITRGVGNDYYPGYSPGHAWLESWNQQQYSAADKFVLTLPGRITRRKGHEDFIRIMQSLVREEIPAYGLIVGAPHKGKERYLKHLKALVKSCGLTGHIAFLGQRDDLREIMAISNIVLSLSREPEAFGRTVLEALALGIPVIAYDIGGASEIMSALFPEGLVPQNDTGSVTRLIRTFRQARPSINRNTVFTLREMLDQTIRLYENMEREK